MNAFMGQSARLVLLAILGLVVVSSATRASAVQRMYAGQLRMGMGDAGPTLDSVATPSGAVPEFVDSRNNAIPACAAPGATVSPSGMASYPPITSMGAGPGTGTIDFFGLAEVATTGSGEIDPSQPIEFLAVGPTPAGLNQWGATTSCPSLTNGVPGGLFFRRTQMARFSWPATTGSIGPGLGAAPALTVGGALSPPSVVASRTWFVPWLGATLTQRIRAEAGPNRYGGSVALAGTAPLLVGINDFPQLPAGTFLISIPYPLAIGRGGGTGLTPSGQVGVVPTERITLASIRGKAVTDPPVQRQPGGPLPPPSAPDHPIPAFASALGFAWTTGVVTAFDELGDFYTTRTRSGSALDVAGPFGGSTTAHVQLVSPSVVFHGLTALQDRGEAVTAELEVRFVPESSTLSALMAGVCALAVARRMSTRRARRGCRRDPGGALGRAAAHAARTRLLLADQVYALGIGNRRDVEPRRVPRKFSHPRHFRL